MRIGIDGRELLGNRTGVGRYLAELCSEWMNSYQASQHEFILYTTQSNSRITEFEAPFQDGISGRFQHRSVPGRPGTLWEQISLPEAAASDKLDVFFSPAYSAPLNLHTPSVVTMHDVSFVTHPEWFPWREGIRRRWLARKSMERADAIIAVSTFTRNEIQNAYFIPSDRIHVVRSGIKHRQIIRRSENSTPLVLYVGTIFNRRNLPTLIRAFTKARNVDQRTRLTLVGDDRSYPKEDLSSLIDSTGMTGIIDQHRYVSESELDILYGQARVFAFLSEYEGFGFTPLEAMSAGIPVVVGDTPVARELYGNAAIFVPIRDTEQTANAIRSLLSNDTQWLTQRDRGFKILESFDWKRCANETLAVLESAGKYH